MPALARQPEKRTKYPRQNAPVVQQQVEVVLDEWRASLHRLKRPINRDQYENIEERDREQEQRRNGRSDDVAEGFERIEATAEANATAMDSKTTKAE